MLLSILMAACVGCTSRTASDPVLHAQALAFLQHYPDLTPAEASGIERQIESGPDDLASQLDAARREGILIRLAELQAPQPAPDQNAAPIYIRLRQLLKARPLDPATDKIRGSLGARVWHTPPEEAAVRRLLTERKDALALVHAAARKPACVFRRDWARGLLLEYPENAAMREAARLFSAESFFLAEEGRYRDAVANQSQVFQIANHATTEPVVISQLVGMACEAIALAGMENILCKAGPNAEAAEAVRTAVSTHPLHLLERRTLEGDLALYSVGMNGLRRDAPLTDASHRRLRLLYGSGNRADPADVLQKYPLDGSPLTNHFLDAAQASYLDVSRSLIAACQQPYSRARPLLTHLRQLAAADSRNPIEQMAASGPVLGQFLTAATRARAEEGVIIAGAAVLAYEARNGAAPSALEQAVLQPPADPFGSGPLRYRREGDGFVVYSVGADGDFDGGHLGMPRDRHQTYFRYPATPGPARR